MSHLRASRYGGRGRLALAAAAIMAVCGIAMSAGQGRAAAPVYGYEVVNVYPHDREAFTQGLLFRDGVLYESTGLKGRSSLRKVQLETGKVLQQISVEPRYFAEGLTDWGSRLVQLTWDTNVGFIYDITSFKRLQTFSYTGEGWGLARDDKQLIMSDGTATLRYLDPKTLAVTRQTQITDGGVPVRDLNELEFVDGQIYANVWLTDRIAMIAPDSGRVAGWINLAGLMSPRTVSDDAVLNGIAYDAQRKRLFVTGKLWPSLFEVRIRK